MSVSELLPVIDVWANETGELGSDPRIASVFETFNLEKALIVGTTTMVSGLVLLAVAIDQWRVARFGALDYDQTMRWVIPGVTLTALGFQMILSSFFCSILGMRRVTRA